MSGFIDVTAADGHTLSVYVAGPEDAKAGLVVVQEIFGVNRHMRSVCDAFAQAGYRVASPALFDRVQRGTELGYTPMENFRHGLEQTVAWYLTEHEKFHATTTA